MLSLDSGTPTQHPYLAGGWKHLLGPAKEPRRRPGAFGGGKVAIGIEVSALKKFLNSSISRILPK